MPLLAQSVSSFVPREQPQPHIEDEHVRLRPWTVADAPIVRSAFADPAIQQWHRMWLASEREAVEWIEEARGRWTTGKSASWAVTMPSGIVEGQVGLRAVNLFEGQAELSYWTLSAHRGRGTARQAATLLTGWAFEVMHLHRLELNHATSNLASCRVAQRLGFALEGTKREQLRHTDGWHDMHLHARLATDT